MYKGILDHEMIFEATGDFSLHQGSSYSFCRTTRFLLIIANQLVYFGWDKTGEGEGGAK